ncbi:hypothetical protein [Treponema sp. R80B11-R83G3]
MVNKNFWLGILVLVFGMMVIGCGDGSTDDDYDNRPSLRVFVDIDNYYPVIGETITASYSNPFNHEVIGSPSWTWYKTTEELTYSDDVLKKTSVGYGNTYTVKQTDVGFFLHAVLTYSGNSGFDVGSTSSVLGIPATATVSVSISASRVLRNDSYSTMPNHYVRIILALSDGRWNPVSYNTAKNWISLSGIPSVSSWVPPSGYIGPYVSNKGRNLVFVYSTRSETTLSINNLTAALVSSQLSTMRSNTNVYNSLTTGTPSSASVSQWTISEDLYEY